MKLVFTKRAGKYDELCVFRPGCAPQEIACPKQGIIPHDMVHFAVESTLAQRGFLALLAGGQNAAFTMQADASHEAVERLVEVFQAEMWGGRLDDAVMIETYMHACAARGHASVPVTSTEVAQIRELLGRLGREWAELAVNAALILYFPAN